MDSTSLRLTLILIGLVVLALIWFLHKPEGRGRTPGATRRDGQKRQEPAIEPTRPSADDAAGDEDEAPSAEPRQTQLPDLGSEAPDWSIESPRRTDAERLREAGDPGTAPAGRPSSRVEPKIESAAAAASGERIEPRWPGDETETSVDETLPRGRSEATDGGEPPKVVTLYLRARGERLISGLTLLDSAIKAGLRFGEMKIFHRRHQGADKPVFSMANITRPGSFDPSGWNLFETPGVTLFLTLPGPVSALDAWDAMLATGQRLSELLEADLMDDSQCLLTRQRISQIREEMREFDRKAGLDG